MKRFIFVSGGVRSGKSVYAVKMAERMKREVTFIATAIAFDEEMAKRIEKHRAERPGHWDIIEEPRNIAPVLTESAATGKERVIIIDCMGLLINNLLLDDMKRADVEERIAELAAAIVKSPQTVIVVSNEVGCGIVPENDLARKFRDLTGSSNRMMAEKADTVIIMQCGIPVVIKGGKNAEIT